MTAVFLKILSMSLTASAVIFVIILLRFPLKKAPKLFSYFLWFAALFRLLCPISFELPSAPVTPVSIGTQTRDEYYNAPNISETQYSTFDIYDGGEVVIYTSENENVPVYRKSKQTVDILSYIWAAGVFCMAVWGTVSYIRLRKRLKKAVYISENGCYISENITNPFIMGIFRPKIYIPSGLAENERNVIITHEKAHLRRCDHIAKLVMYIALCVHWFNPLVWVMFGLFERDMEMSCDERVTAGMTDSERADYSQVLLNISAKPAAAFTACFGESGTKQRVKNVLGFKKPAIWIIILCSAVLAASAVILTANRAGDEPAGEFPEAYFSDPTSSLMLSSYAEQYEYSEGGVFIKAAGGEWSCNIDGIADGCAADAVHPLDINAPRTLLKPHWKVMTVYLYYSHTRGYDPDRLIIMGWDKSCIGDLSAKPLISEERDCTAEYNGMIQLSSDMIYSVKAVWDKDKADKRGYSGSCIFYAETEKINLNAYNEGRIMNSIDPSKINGVYVKNTVGGSYISEREKFEPIITAVSSARYERVSEATPFALGNFPDMTVTLYTNSYNYNVFSLIKENGKYYFNIDSTNSIHMYELSEDDFYDIVQKCEQHIKEGYFGVMPEGEASPSDGISLAPVTAEWSERVYFGSEFPRIIYADNKVCIFTEGCDSIFRYDFDKQKITFSANIKESFENAGKKGFGAESWNGVGMGACAGENGTEIICSLYWQEGNITEYYTLDFENRILTPVNAENEVRYITNRSMTAPDAEIFGLDTFYNGDGYVSLYISQTRKFPEPGEASCLPTIEIVRNINGKEDRYIPFNDMAGDQ